MTDPDVTRISSNEEPPEEFDSELFDVLDQYVQQIHAGELTRSQLLINRPDLGGLLSCLESLEGFAAEVGLPPAPPVESARSGSTFNPSSLDPERFAEGVRFGNYVLLGELGRGGMGVVFQARQVDLNRCVAIKMILSSHLASQQQVARFRREAQAAGRLRHPNIVGIHEVGDLDGQHYFTMDCVEGESLAQKLKRGPCDPDEAAHWTAQIARAVHYLHRHEIIHRDLKPSNILFDDSDTPFVTDFGLAKLEGASGEQTRTGTIIGTASYMSPEQAAGSTSETDARSDVWSVGAMLYEMLTGKPPFREERLLDTLREVMEGEPPEPRSLRRSLRRELELICLKCLEKNPERRYQSAEELADDLEAYLKGEPMLVREPSLSTTLRRWARREPALASRWAGLAAAMGITQGAYMLWGVDWTYHVRVSTIFAIWAVVAFVFQQLMVNWQRFAEAIRFAWSAADTVMLTWLLLPLDSPIGPLMIGYPMLVSACGLFFRVRLVIFQTFASLIGMLVLIVVRHRDSMQSENLRREWDFGPPQYPVVFASVTVIIGAITAYQVYRLRRLSRHYERESTKRKSLGRGYRW